MCVYGRKMVYKAMVGGDGDMQGDMPGRAAERDQGGGR